MAASARRWYRRPPGAGWLAVLIVVPLAITAIGWSGTPSDDTAQGPPGAVAAPVTGAPMVMVAPFSLRRKGDDVILSGQLPDQASVAFAMDLVRENLPGATVLDTLTPIPGITAADLSRFDEVLAAGAPLPDFGFSIEGGDVVLFGTARSDEAKLGLADAVRAAWPDLNVLNDIAVLAPAAPG